jgi:chromosome partitioning protein
VKDKQRRLLRKTRLKAKISATQAASLAFVEPRTWRAWESGETGEDKGAARSPSTAALWSFFARSGIKMPDFNAKVTRKPSGIAFAIASYKGGVGKTPITLNVAACLVEQGHRVAIVTDDLVYRSAHEEGLRPAAGSLVSHIDFYDELDLITFPADVRQRRAEMRLRLATLQPHEEPFFRTQHRDELEALERKRRATEKLGELIARYDYVLIDMYRPTELIRRFASLIAIVMDTNCSMSVRSAEKFAGDLRAVNCRQTTPGYFGLLTNCEAGDTSRGLEAFLADHFELDDSMVEKLLEEKHSACRRRELARAKIDALDFPKLRTELSRAYDVAIEMYELDADNPRTCDYYDSLMDFAPSSQAAREIRQLTDELVNWRLKPSTLPF